MSQKIVTKVYEENGVHYCHLPLSFELPPPGMTLYFYHWRYIPTGDQGMTAIYCYSELNLITLVNYWNSMGSRFQYWV